jgi:hypothetical protein
MAAGSADQPAPDDATSERYGLVAIARMRKEDGRALILYSHDEREGHGAAPAAEQTTVAPAASHTQPDAKRGGEVR